MRIRKKIKGTENRPRMAVYRSNQELYVQFIDDANNCTLVSASTLIKGSKAKSSRVSLEDAAKLGKTVAELAKGKGIEEVVFDRGGFNYGGKIKAVAEAAREGGLKF